MSECAVVFDVGKTNAKLTLWSGDGELLDRRVRSNEIVQHREYRALDVSGLESWLAATLRDFARFAKIGLIVPVCHGAAAALVLGDRLFTPPMDYEGEVDAEERAAYLAQRDDFSATGSPLLPYGLNLGLQLHRLERLTGPWPKELRILLWPQYWAWRLGGVMAAEVTSLGCHSDLWRPLENRFSDLAQRRGWDKRLPPFRHASETLSTVTAEWTATGLPKDCKVLCGLHDSNAALLAARGHPEVREKDLTVLSTGTWFIAMRVPRAPPGLEVSHLTERRDCLLNVDPDRRPTPSARFMGGREAELIVGAEEPGSSLGAAISPVQLQALLKTGAAALPSFVPGVGPFPDAKARWCDRPSNPNERRAVAALYLALMADECLTLVGSLDRIVIEGRFAEWDLFAGALSRLRPRQELYLAPASDDIPFGALRLARPDLTPRNALIPVRPLDVDFEDYARRWHAHAGN